MKIPEWVDKWIVFALVSALEIEDLAHTTGMPISAVEYLLDPLMMATLFMLAFLICRALCRLVARMLGENPATQRVRLISNVLFFSGLALIVLQPLLFPDLIQVRFTVQLPKRVSIHW